MFDKKDMMVSVLVAEEMITENNKNHEEAIEKMSELYNKTINSMKLNARLQGVLSIHNNHFDFGQPTPFYSNGIQLFTGDEVEFKSGKKGIVVCRSDRDGYFVYTNAEIAKIVSRKTLVEMKRVFFQFEGFVTGDRLAITKHFNELTLGEEVAKGRKGAKGFIVTELWSEVSHEIQT